MTQVRYMLDTNALTKLSRSERSSRLVRDNCRIPADVAREAQGLPDANDLHPLVYATTRAVLLLVQEVMSTVPAGDRKLVDLYANKGTADPALIACALDATDQSRLTLFDEEWRIVSDDKAVRTKAAEFGIISLRSHEFISELRAGLAQVPPD